MQAATMGPPARSRRHEATREDGSGMPRALIQLTVRVEPATYEAALRAAQGAGLSLSAWLAQVIRERAEQQAPPGGPGDGAQDAQTAPGADRPLPEPVSDRDADAPTRTFRAASMWRSGTPAGLTQFRAGFVP